MKVNFKAKVKDYKGIATDKFISDELAKALFYVTDKDQFNCDEKYTAYKLCGKLNAGDGEIEITVEEASLIKRVAASVFIAGGYGQVCELIETEQN
jgi:hypothetical protein